MGNFAYFMPNGGIEIHTGDHVQMDPAKAAEAFVVIENHEAEGDSFPFLEIVKSRFGASSMILTGNVEAPQGFDIERWLANDRTGKHLESWAKNELRTLCENIHYMGEKVEGINILHFTEFSDVKFTTDKSTIEYRIRKGRNAVLL